MSGLQSLYNLLHKRVDLPCSVAAQEFLSSVKSENDRLSLATNGLVPLLENGKIEVPLRILAAYLLHAIYDFSGTPNPFYNRIAELYALQQKQSISISLNEDSSFYAPPTSQQQMAQLDRDLDGFKYLNIREDNSHRSSGDSVYSRYSGVPESRPRSPLAWVLWKIIRGEANELGSSSPTILADIRLWKPEEYQRRTDLNLPFDTVSSHDIQAPNDFRHIPTHGTPSPPTLSSRSPFISPNYPTPLDGRRSSSLRAVTPSDRYYPVQGYGMSTLIGDAIARPNAQQTNFLVAPGSSRPSSVAYPPSHPSPSSASSTLDSSSINTPNSFVDTSTFSLPRTDSTRVVDASAFYIPQVNRWSTRSEAEVTFGYKDSADFKASPLPHHVGRRFSPTMTSKSSQPSRNPGVIGSGRPSSRGPSEPQPPSERNTESRASYIGIAGDNVTERYSPVLDGLDIQALTLQQQIIRPVAREYLDAPRAGGALLYKTGGDGVIKPPSGNHDFASDSQEKRDHLDPTSASPALPQVVVQSHPQMYSTFQDGVVDYSTSGFNSQASQSMKRGYSGDMENKSTLAGEAVSTIRPGALENMSEGRGTDTQKELGQTSHLNSSPTSPNTYVELSASQRRQNGGAEPDPVAIRERDGLAEAIVLYLMARERVLTLQEQRKLQPHLSMLTRPICVLRPEDIPSLVANNQDIAVKLLVSLLSQDEKEARQIEELLKNIDLKNGRDDNDGVDSMNSLTLVSEMVKLVTSYGSAPPPSSTNDLSPLRGALAIRRYLMALAELPPTIQSFNVIGKLLSPSQSGQPISEELRRIATLIRTEVLGGFISGCIRWIEKADRDEKEGSVHDDRVATATRNLCRFYTALIRYGMIAADSEEDTTEIMSFALQFSRFESAQSLYSILASARA